MSAHSAAEQVSVVIPAFQAEATIAEALASVEGQTLPAESVVVVDDGSSDATSEVVRSASPRTQLIRQNRSGPSAARNRAISEVATPWIAFLDADDRWHPEKLAHQLALVKARPGTDVVATDWIRASEPFPPLPPAVGRTTLSERDIAVLNRFQTSTVLCRTSAVRQAGGFDPDLDGAEDWDMWLRLARGGPVVKLDWPYVAYRDVASGYSKDLWRVYETMLRMIERESEDGALSGPGGETIIAWHHLRFATAFLLARSPRQAAAVARELRSAHLVSAAPAAAVRYLGPFLAGRGRRRARRVLRSRSRSAAPATAPARPVRSPLPGPR